MKRKMKIVLIVVVLLIVAGAAANLILRYFKYDDYKQYVASYEVEEGTEFTALSESKSDVAGMVLVAENDSLKLYTNLETTEIAVYNKETGDITYSNPKDRDQDAIASGVNASDLNSTMSITYYNAARNSATMNNYDMSIEKGQFVAEQLKDGIRYVYTLADLDSSTGIVPTQMTEERFQSMILDKVDESDARTVKGKFELKNGVYYLNEKAMESKVGMKKLNKIFEDAGYTADDFNVDMSETEGEENMSFTIPLEYRLTAKGLEVSIPTSQIEEKGGASIARIRVLPFFAAAGTDAEGYMLVPNGSGSLINLNNGCKNASYSQNIYGIDPVVQSYVVTENTQTARLPVFGMKNGDTAVLGRITDGDALAIVDADVSGKLNSYNYVYPEFCVREIELLNMFGVTGNKADTPVLETDMYDTDITVDYSFLTGKDADYSGMAACYRQQLLEDGTLVDQTSGDELPMYLDIVGGVEIKKHILGIPYNGVYAMTTYDEASEILDEFYGADITNIRMNYQGWFNGGVYHDVADKIDLINSVGSKKDMKNLAEKLEENGGGLYGDVAFQKASETSKRFNGLLESSKYYSGYAVELGAVNPATMRQTSTLNWYNELAYYVVSPKFVNRYVNEFTDDVTKYDMTGVNLRDLGNVLASDKKRTELINRQQAEEVVVAQYEKLKGTGKALMENGGNEYSLSYVSDIIDAPTSYSQFYIIDKQIPFYEMVVHGSVNYAGESINLSDTQIDQDLLLQYVEYGIAPRFTMSYEDSSNIKYTSSADKYSVLYTTWMDDAKSIYGELSTALDPVVDAQMTRHETLDSGLVKVEYSNGVTIYVNKTDEPITDDGVTVEAKDYQTTGGVAQ